ncbi:MAG: AIM24 family protein, partial [Pseudomonadota bacterium]
MQCHQVDYEIFGDDMQVVEVELDPQEVVIAEAGAMNYMEDGITFDTKMGDGSTPSGGLMDSLLNVGKRVLTGESIFMTHFTNSGHGKKRVAFAAPYPGKIMAIDMAQMGGELICQKDAFLCAAYGTQVGIALQRKLGA